MEVKQRKYCALGGGVQASVQSDCNDREHLLEMENQCHKDLVE